MELINLIDLIIVIVSTNIGKGKRLDFQFRD